MHTTSGPRSSSDWLRKLLVTSEGWVDYFISSIVQVGFYGMLCYFGLRDLNDLLPTSKHPGVVMITTYPLPLPIVVNNCDLRLPVLGIYHLNSVRILVGNQSHLLDAPFHLQDPPPTPLLFKDKHWSILFGVWCSSAIRGTAPGLTWEQGQVQLSESQVIYLPLNSFSLSVCVLLY